ncbi:hypothetical protein [Zhongshania sp.]|jgi:hypothetical protein|uniref:hypothetical protein n=1 Tax=Zhongshania sp. TaxID=1971902 RepID=UPI002A823AD5|nr:hypothetical protein [Zhongshania sp.]
MRFLLIGLVVSLVGCAGQLVPAVQPTPVMCQVPAGLLALDPAPSVPAGDYSQADVAMYISKLHQWAWNGWLRIGAIDKWVSQHSE